MIFKESELQETDRQDVIRTYSDWLLRRTFNISDQLKLHDVIPERSREMSSNLASIFAERYQADEEEGRTVIFSGKSAPLHQKIFDSAISRAQTMAQVRQPDILTFDDWQNQRLYRGNNITAVNINNLPEPLLVLGQLHSNARTIEIHEDHTRAGGKYAVLIELWQKGFIDNIFEYSSPAYPESYLNPKFFFGLRESRFNIFMSSLSKLFSEREFYRMHRLLNVFDARGGIIPIDHLDRFDQAMEVLDQGLNVLRTGIEP